MAFKSPAGDTDPSLYEHTLTRAEYYAVGGRTKYAWAPAGKHHPGPPAVPEEDRRQRTHANKKKQPQAA